MPTVWLAACGADSAFTEELQRELAEGKVVLGGCDIDIFHPTPSYHCNDCEEEF